jgi:hypothetical protein
MWPRPGWSLALPDFSLRLAASREINRPKRTVRFLIGARQRKSVTGLEPRIFSVSQRKPIASQGSAEGAAVGILLESQPFEWSEKLGRHKVDNNTVLIAFFLGRCDFGLNGRHKHHCRPELR